MNRCCLWAAVFSAAAVMSLSAVGAGAARAHSASATPIVIGVTADLTGYADVLGIPWAKAAEVWAKWINDNGGIDGHPVALLIEDTKSDPATTTNVLNELLSDPKVVVIVHGGDDTLVESFATVAKAATPVIAGIYDDNLATNNSNVFPVGASKNMVRMEAIVGLGFGADKARPNGAFLTIPDDTYFLFPLQTAARRAGADIVYTSVVPKSPPADFDYTSLCRAAQAKNAGWVFFLLFQKPVARVAESCAKIGYKPTWITGYFIDSFQKVPALDGVKIPLSNAPFNGETPAVKEFRRAVAKYDPDQLKDRYFGESTLVSWTSMQLIAKAVETARPKGAEVTRDDVYRGLYGLKNETLGGLAPPLTYHRGQPTDIGCFIMTEIRSGQLVTTSDKAVCY